MTPFDTGLVLDQIAPPPSSGRRTFLKALSGGALGVAAIAVGVESAAAKNEFDPLWDWARILVGQSPSEQHPNSFIKCPLFHADGHFAHAYHTQDLSNLRRPVGTIIHGDDVVEPNFGPSIAVAITTGTDGVAYLLVGGEGKVTAGKGYFRRVDKAIVRCKYKVPAGSSLNNPSVLLISCVACVVVLVRT